MNVAITRNIMMMEQRFRKDIVVGVAMTLPMKMALMEAASRDHVALSVFIRSAAFAYLENKHPNFYEEVYLRCLAEQTEIITSQEEEQL